MCKKLVLSILLAVLALASYAQDSEIRNLKVVNDPLLWTNMLKLKSNQKDKIMRINDAFYNAIIVEDTQKQRLKTKSELTPVCK